MQKIKIGVAAVSILMLAVGSASAAHSGASHTFTLELTDGCSVDTSGVVSDLGSYPVTEPDLIGQDLGTVRITCVAAIDYDWGVDGGNNYNFNTDPRRWMSGTSTPFPYELFSDIDRIGDVGLNSASGGTYVETTNAGGQLSSGGIAHPGGGLGVTYNLHGDFYISQAFPPASTPAPGIYSDTVNFVVAWL